MAKIVKIFLQEGYQERFFSSKADIVIGGGAAGAGKSYGLLLKPVQHLGVKGFGAVIFRRTYPEIMREGGLWDDATKLYSGFGGRPVGAKWVFPTGSRVSFSHLQYEKDLLAFQGSQIPMIGFDELTHFSKKMFFYLLSRNRSTCGVPPFVRATCNPDPDSWVSEFISWWIDQDTGFPIPERDGVIRYFTRDGEAYIWGSTKQEVIDKVPHLFDSIVVDGVNKEDLIKSVTFIAGNIRGNKELLKVNPAYLANLMSQDSDTKLRLLEGNWKIRTDSTSLFEFVKINDLFTNIVKPKSTDKHYMVIDHARFGKDLCVMGTWHGWRCIRIDILPMSDTNDIMKVVHSVRAIYSIPMSNIIIDQDGIGVKDSLGCRIFQGGKKAHKVDRKIQNYKNLKTQCYYLASEIVNNNEAFFDLMNVWLHSSSGLKKVEKMIVSGKEQSVRVVIRDELRVVKRENPDLEHKQQITSKAAIKELLGRSPDFADMIAMRAEFEFVKEKRGLKRK